MAYTLSEIRPDDKRGQTKLRALLEGEGITLDGNLDYTCGLFDEDYQLVGDEVLSFDDRVVAAEELNRAFGGLLDEKGAE